MMTISVLIPTYRRVESLNRCLEALRRQSRDPDEILVVVRTDDEESLAFLNSWQDWKALRVIQTSQGGQVNQLNAGLEAGRGDIFAITDDDAAPTEDWLRRIEQHFVSNPDLGGVGGRDLVWEQDRWVSGSSELVGTIRWFGRVVGNHHLGAKLLSNVDVLKGANMAYLRVAVGDLRFDSDLRGKGAQTCNDMAFSLGVQKRGWRLLFDPEVAVKHFPAQRFDLDQRGAPSHQALEDDCFNYYLTLRRHMRSGLRRSMAIAWARMIGTPWRPGFVRGVVATVKRDRAAVDARRAARSAWNSATQIR